MDPEHVAPREVLAKWQMNENPAEDLMGFAVARSDAPEGHFSFLHNELLAAATRELRGCGGADSVPQGVDGSPMGGLRYYSGTADAIYEP